MSAKTGYYSLIQYCPDRSRLEAMNVGVLLCSPEHKFLDCRMSRSNARLRTLAKSVDFDARAISSAKDAMTNRIHGIAKQVTNLDDLKRFVDTRANDLLLTQPRPCRVVDPEAELECLFEELVGGQRALKKPGTRRAKFEELDAIFDRPELEGKVLRDQKLSVPIMGKRFHAPYAYINGFVNLVKPETFPADESKAQTKVSLLAVEAQLIQKMKDEMRQLGYRVIYVLRKQGTTPEIITMVQQLLAEFEIDVVIPDGMATFEKQVLQEAHS